MFEKEKRLPAGCVADSRVYDIESECQIASSSTVSSAAFAVAGVSSEVAASSFFMIENMNRAESRHRAMSIAQIVQTGILPQRIMGMDTR